MVQSITGRVHGRVQGVGFRYSTMRAAERLGIAGWVRNNRDGTVEYFAQGTPAEIETFLDFLRVGPPHARVDRVDVTDAAPEPSLRGFGVR